jgi:hypothetical protein
MRPDIAVVLVDCDGENARKSRLDGYVATLPVACVVAVAVQEFEAWLLADTGTVAKATGTSRPFAGPPENLQPGAAKRELAEWLSPIDVAEARRRIAAECDLTIVAKTCRSLSELMRELATKLARH